MSLYGYDRATFLQMSLHEVRSDDEFGGDLNVAIEAIRDTTADHQSGPHKHVSADGSELTVRVESTYVVFDGRPARLVMLVDLTEELTTQRTLHEREAQIRLFIDQLPAIMWTTDAELRFSSAAGNALTKIDVDPHSGIGVHVDAMFRTIDGKPGKVVPAHVAAL